MPTPPVFHRAALSLVLPVLATNLFAGAPLPPSPITLTDFGAIRVAEGSTADVDFGVANSDGGSVFFDLDVTGIGGTLVDLTLPDGVDEATGTPWFGVEMLGSTSGTLSTQADISGVTGGTSVTFGVNAMNLAWGDSPTASTNIDVVSNRLLTGTGTFNNGRHLYTEAIGTLQLDGGLGTLVDETEINVDSGGYAQFGNGIRLTSSADHTFDGGANQFHSLDVQYNGQLGSYTIDPFNLPASNSYVDGAGAQRLEFGGEWVSEAGYGDLLGNNYTVNSPDSGVFNGGTAFQIAYEPGVSGTPNPEVHPGSYVWNHQLAETSQPSLPENIQLTTAQGIDVNAELSRGTGLSLQERQQTLISSEVIPNSVLDLSGVQIEATGTAVANRNLQGGVVDLGRQMVVGTGSPTVVNRNDNMSVTTYGGDDTRTRLRLNAFSETDGGITATLNTAQDFTDGADTASVQLQGNFSYDPTTAGTTFHGVNVASNIDSLEMLAGESVDSSLWFGYEVAVVDNNNLLSNDLLVLESANQGGTRSYFLGSSTPSNAVLREEFSTSTHTNLSFSNLQVGGSYAPGEHALGTSNYSAANGNVFGEGLAGESVIASASFDTTLVAVAGRDTLVGSTNVNPGELTDGDIISISDNGAAADLYHASTLIASLDLRGDANLSYDGAITGAGALIAPGQSSDLALNYSGPALSQSAGTLGRAALGTLQIALTDQVDVGGILADVDPGGTRALRANNLNSSTDILNYQLETRFDVPDAASGTGTIHGGTDLFYAPAYLTNTLDNTGDSLRWQTRAELIDSNRISSDSPTTITFTDLDSAPTAEIDMQSAASRAGIYIDLPASQLAMAGDIVDVTGLNGEIHVLQLTGGDNIGQNIGQANAQLLWQTTFDGSDVWINAVLGNSNISELDLTAGTLKIDDAMDATSIQAYLTSMRFGGSYADFLAGTSGVDGDSALDGVLGTWGVDGSNNHVWAIIDHNSSFGVGIPEPSSLLLVGLGLGGCLVRRRRTA